MPRVIERTVYAFSELSEKAQKYARQVHVEQDDYPHDNWWSFDDFIECAKCLGIEIEMGWDTAEKRMPIWAKPQIHFSLGGQGSGASFLGTYRVRADAVDAIFAHAPLDEVLLALATRLTVLQVRAQFAYGKPLYGQVTQRNSNYVHSGSMDTVVDVLGDGETTIDHDDERELVAILRAFADWMYAQLQAQHDWYFTNDYIDEALVDTDFDERGVIS